jgi:putative membrane protein insertion efficiency factor
MSHLLRKVIAALMLGLIRLYQLLLSPLLGAKCRYTPTCSAYAVDAIKKWGPWKGGWLALKRIASCRPGGGSGWDPVP